MTIEERQLKTHEGDGAQLNRIGDRPTWQQRLRTHIVSRGIQAMCGSVDVAPNVATDILSDACRCAVGLVESSSCRGG